MASERGRLDIKSEGLRWNELKSVLQLSDEALATLLIDSYLQTDSPRNGTSKRRKGSMKSRKMNKATKTQSFDLSEYGVQFPQQERENDLDLEPVSAIDEVFNLNYGHSIENDATRINQTTLHPAYVTDPCAASRESAYIVHNSCLIQLANQNPPSHCNIKNCRADVSMVKKQTGTTVYFIWACSKGHTIREWSSQPSLQGEGHLGDLILACGIVMSGCNYNQIALLFKLLNIDCINSESFEYFNCNFVQPKILSYWNSEQREILSALNGRDVILVGCGLRDQSEDLMKFLTFCVLDYESNDVLYISILDKDSVDVAMDSEKLELQAFIQALQSVQASGARVIEVVTNIQPKINNLLRKKYPEIKRSFDMWDGAKFIGKTIVQASNHTNCQNLLPWLPEIINHFLETSKTCAEISGSLWVSTDEEAFKDSFVTGIIHHTMNNHKWMSGQCLHGPLEDEDAFPWLQPDSPAHNQLKHVLLDKKMSSIIGNFSTNRTTCGLEKLVKYISVYTSNNNYYSFEEYKCRVYLAVLDFINHHNLPNHVDDQGQETLEKTHSSYSSQFEYQNKQESKQYLYLPRVVEKIVGAALNSLMGGR
ncbi:hypothetical protein LOTGIDRAFT_160195 [Lottia gigantea]|uniref:Uncharacterized protein n=1 Tax=Lottia gigantea TaxID=225164 RepID=V3ZVV7_LOTGI|nr:hypothetical protein LOTGIDRAFT_160195 [Lottia gigantea]ESO95648.1 hypothetical protein LOTGIDRAFT_160195 [Lottia gigantea]